MDKSKGFIHQVEQSIIEHWDQDALTDYQGETLRYSDVARKIAKLHIGMETLGLLPGDRGAICGRNSAGWTVAFFAVITYGCVVVPIQNDFKPEQVHNIVNHSGALFLFVGDGVAPTIDFEQMPGLAGIGYLPDLSIRNYRTVKLRYVREHLNELFGKKYPSRFTREHVHYTRERSMDDLAILNYTSGTTGHSKGVMIPYRSMLSNLEFTTSVLGRGAKSGDRLVSTLPMGHTFGMTCEMIFSFIQGVHIYYLNRQPSPTIIMQMCQEIKPCMLLAVPLVMEKIMRKHVFPYLDKSRMRMLAQLPLIKTRMKTRMNEWINEQLGGQIYQVFTGGAPINQEIEQFLMSIDFPITSGYGCTETGPMITFSDWHDHKFGSCGTVVPNMEIRINSSDPENIPGELLAKGDSVMIGYYKNDEATAEVLDKDGWFHTGDLGKISASGHLYLLGRIKNMLLGANGQNIYPEEIEDKLNSMPMVNESVVVQNGTQLVALVYPDQEALMEIDFNKDELALLMEENRQQLNEVLPAYCKVSEIRTVDHEFEKTAKKSIKRYLYKLS